MYYIRYLYQYNHRLRFKVTKTSASMTSFRTHDFDHRYPLCFHLHHIISSVAFLRFWRCARLHSGGKDEPVWLGVILRYQLPKLSWRRRQHDAFRSLVFWLNVIFPTILNFPENLCCSRYAVVRPLHPVNHKSCSTSRGASRIMTKCNGIKNPKVPHIIATRHYIRCRASPLIDY